MSSILKFGEKAMRIAIRPSVLLTIALTLWAALAGCVPAHAASLQAAVTAACDNQDYPTTRGYADVQQTQGGSLCVHASVSASIAGFSPAGTYASLTATASSSSSTALPAGATVAFYNVGSSAVSCVLASGAATAVASRDIIQPGGSAYFTVGSNDHTACIDQTGSASNTVVLSGGSGLGANTGGLGTGATTQAVNETQVGGASYALGSATSSASAPVVIASDQAAVAVKQSTASNLNATVVGAGSAGTPNAGVETVQGAAGMTPVLVTPSAPADPCFASAKLTGSFSSTSSGGSIVTAASGKKIYVCQVTVVTSAAAAVSFIEGTGSSVCTGGTTAGDWLNTGITAANGAAFGANGGVSAGAGTGTVFQTATANQNLCLVFSTTNTPTVVASVTYVQQ